MQKIDRLVWAAGFCGSCFGYRVGVRANSPAALERLRPLLPVGWQYTERPVVDLLFSYIDGGPPTRLGVKRFNILYLGAGRLARTLEPKEIAATFERTLEIQVAEAAPRHAFVHAGAVGWRGRAIVIPGFSFTGKSTLTAALVKAGATYYSDEYAVFTAGGRVQPYARPLQLREGEGLTRRRLPVEELGGKAGTRSLPLGLIVETHYKPGRRWRPRRGTAGHGALALMAHAVPIQRRPGWTMGILTRAARAAVHLKGVRGDADEVAHRILTEFADW